MARISVTENTSDHTILFATDLHNAFHMKCTVLCALLLLASLFQTTDTAMRQDAFLTSILMQSILEASPVRMHFPMNSST
jgi:hypothetical protein